MQIFRAAALTLRDAGGSGITSRIDVDVGTGTEVFESPDQLNELTTPAMRGFDRIHGWAMTERVRVDVTMTRRPRIDADNFAVAVLLKVRPQDGADGSGLVKIRDDVLRAIERGRPSSVREPRKGFMPSDAGAEAAVRTDIAEERKQAVFSPRRAVVAAVGAFGLLLAFPWLRGAVPGLSPSDALLWGDPSLEEVFYIGVTAAVMGAALEYQNRLLATAKPEGVQITGGPRSWWVTLILAA